MTNGDVVVLAATPGRLLDHLQNTPAVAEQLAQIDCLILDECDQLLGQGFWPDIQKIIQYLPPASERQTLLFSATLNDDIETAVQGVMATERLEIIDTVGEEADASADRVAQRVTVTPVGDQMPCLVAELQRMQAAGEKVIVFFPTARQTGLAALQLKALGLQVNEIHSRLSQSRRKKESDGFRDAAAGILVSSDVSARGLDYPGV